MTMGVGNGNKHRMLKFQHEKLKKQLNVVFAESMAREIRGAES